MKYFLLLLLLCGCDGRTSEQIASSQKFEQNKLKVGQIVTFKVDPSVKAVLTKDEWESWGCHVRYMDKTGVYQQVWLQRYELNLAE